MNPWIRRLIYFLILFVWLLFMSLPVLSFALAARNQLQIGPTEGNHLRIFLVQEMDAEGIGLELTRPSQSDLICQQTSVRYLMWKGKAENVTYRLCSDSETGDALPASQGTCLSG
jgi:hypothetical protein